MSDYISREAAVKIAQKYGLVNGSALGRHTGLADCIAIEIEGVPAADVEPVRRGRWEPGNRICPVCGEDKFKGLDADVWSDWTPACCPNCGAKMCLEDETNDN